MKKSRTNTLNSAFKLFLKVNGLETKYKEAMLINSWEKAVGGFINKNTKKMFIKNRILFVYISSSVVRNELQMVKTALISKLNQGVGERIIDDIVLR